MGYRQSNKSIAEDLTQRWCQTTKKKTNDDDDDDEEDGDDNDEET